MSITILGLGPGDPNALTLEARAALENARDCKLTLLLYPPEHAVTRVDAAGTSQQKIETLLLAEVGHADYWAAPGIAPTI